MSMLPNVLKVSAKKRRTRKGTKSKKANGALKKGFRYAKGGRVVKARTSK